MWLTPRGARARATSRIELPAQERGDSSHSNVVLHRAGNQPIAPPPSILRELYFRLLQGEQQGRVAEIAIGDGRVRRIAGAIAWIKAHYVEPLQIEALAKQVNMSPSALHRHFPVVTGVSPIQYQKWLRLEEARRLLLSDATSAEAVAYQVGYASASQFSREYARLFGQPPRRDAERLRAEA